MRSLRAGRTEEDDAIGVVEPGGLDEFGMAVYYWAFPRFLWKRAGRRKREQ